MSEDTKKCPYCAETIMAEAIVCRFCGKNLSRKLAEKIILGSVMTAVIVLAITASYAAGSGTIAFPLPSMQDESEKDGKYYLEMVEPIISEWEEVWNTLIYSNFSEYAPLIARLQSIHRQARRLEVPADMKVIHSELVNAMSIGVEVAKEAELAAAAKAFTLTPYAPWEYKMRRYNENMTDWKNKSGWR